MKKWELKILYRLLIKYQKKETEFGSEESIRLNTTLDNIEKKIK